MQTLSKMAKIPKSNWDNAGVVFIQKAITICDSNWQDGNKTQKRKKYVFKTFVNKCHENWKKSKTTYSLSYHLQNKKKQISRSLQKASELIENWSKLIRNLIKTDQKLMSSQSLFLSFLFPPKNNAFLQVIFMKSENHFGVSKKNKLESYQ